jgi:hypothetical protein
MDELVKRLRDFAVELRKAEDALLVRDAADAIEELGKLHETQKKNLSVLTDAYMKSWIPVTERLPGTGEIVLVYGKRGGIYTAEHNRNARWPGSFWKLNSKSHHCEPTHWMPLPEPPKEG